MSRLWRVELNKESPEVLYENVVLENLAKFTRKHLCVSLFFNNCNFIKKKNSTQVFSREF